MFIVPKQHPNLADSKYTQIANKLLNQLIKAQEKQKTKAPLKSNYDIQITTLVD